MTKGKGVTMANGFSLSLESKPQVFTSQRADLLAKLPWLVLPYDSLTYLLGLDLAATSQTLPLTALLAIPYLVIRGFNLRSNRSSSIVFYFLLTAFLVMFAVTTVNTLFESVDSYLLNLDARLITWPRQAISMLLGISSFLMFQDAILRTSIPGAARVILWGCIPSLLLGVTQIVLGADRVQGFSSEPSHMADMLVFTFLPACAVANAPVRLRRLLALLGVILLIATFSTTGFLKALFVVLVYFYLQGQLGRGVLWAIVLAGITLALLSFFPDNYVFTMFRLIFDTYEQTGQLLGAGSLVDRFFGLVGPLSQLGGLHGWLGYGFGGDTVYFDRLFDADTANAIREVKGEIVGISSLQGKILMYGGMAGYLIYLFAWRRSLVHVPRSHVARVMIPAVFASSLFSLGPLFLPYVWLWLAIGVCASKHKSLAQSTPSNIRYSTSAL
jgi:hypothetical protein